MQIKKYFADHFTICEALSSQQKDESYRIRHNVYCEEFAYEPRRLDSRETDEYDEQSLHCLVRDKESQEYIACMRFVQAVEGINGSTIPSFEKFPHAFDTSIFDIRDYAPEQLSEVSRLAVVNTHRMRNSDRRRDATAGKQSGEPEQRSRNQRRQHSVVPLSLFLAARFFGDKTGAEIAVAMMEPSLGRMLRMSGILVEPVGKIVDYHGPRAPFVMFKSKVFSELSDDMLELLEHVNADLSVPLVTDDIIEPVRNRPALVLAK